MVKTKCFTLTEKLEIGKGEVYRSSIFIAVVKN